MKSKKGISLIVLVITIIVMIILAAAIILSLNNAGIIGNANKAVSETDYKNVQTAAQLVYADMMLSETEKPTMMLKQGEYIKQKLIAQGTITADQATMYRFKNNGEVVKLQTKAEYETMYKNELAAMEGYYTIIDGEFALNNDGKTAFSSGTIEILAIPYGTVSVVGNVAQNYTKLKKVIMPDTVVTLGGSAFSGCTALDDIVVSKNLKYVNQDFYRTAWLDNLLEESKDGLVIVEGILIDTVNAEDYVKVPNTVEIIAPLSFTYWNKTDFIIPETVEEIGLSMTISWAGCSRKYVNIKFLGQTPVIGNYSFNSLCMDIPDETEELVTAQNSKALWDPSVEYED